MFKALHRPSGEAIVLLDPRWRCQLATLRAWDAQDDLVCQGCLQPVRVRAGRVKRWHFAHKHLRNCPFETESPDLLQARAVLYEWLVDQVGADQVTLEKKIDFVRPVDCWIESAEGSIGYWIIDSRMPPDERTALITALAAVCSYPVWIFTAGMFHADAGNLERLYLTTTEREFMRFTRYDPPAQRTVSPPGASLHYLDADRYSLLTFRGLQVHHPPQLYAGHSYETPLSQVAVDALTGELVHPGEREQLERYLSAVASRKRLQKEIGPRNDPAWANGLGTSIVQQDAHTTAKATPISSPGTAAADLPDTAVTDLPVCVFCGTRTDDYWYVNRADNTCKCRACYRQGKY